MDDETKRRLHINLLYQTIAIDYLGLDGLDLQRFRNRCIPYLTPTELDCRTCTGLLEELERKDLVSVGKYTTLKELLSFNLPLLRKVEDVERKIELSEIQEVDPLEIKDLRSLLLAINEVEVDRIQILPLKPEYRIELDKIYVPVPLTDVCNVESYNNGETQTLDNIINETQSRRLGRFIFFLGEAGYGKTVQCQRIVKSWCHARREEERNEERDLCFTPIERSLQQFDFTFYVELQKMRYESIHVQDIICEAYRSYHSELSEKHIKTIRFIIENARYKCLIVLDGLDEWNIPEEKKKDLNRGTPICENMPNCRILITMRSWKYLEVANIFRVHYDSLIQLQGLDSNYIKELMSRMLIHHCHLESESEEYIKKIKSIEDAISSNIELKSLMKIPLMAVFSILTLCENVTTGHSVTTFYLAMMESLIKRHLKMNESSGGSFLQTNAPSIQATYSYVTYRLSELACLAKNILKSLMSKIIMFEPNVLATYSNLNNHKREFLCLGEVAFKSLTSEITLEFSKEEQIEALGGKTLDFFLRIGMLKIEDTKGRIHEDKFRISFLHKSIQEFLASLYVYETGKVKDILANILDIEKALEWSSVLIFLSGLSASVGHKISEHIYQLSINDGDIVKYREYFSGEYFRKVFYLYDLQIKCYREARGCVPIKDFLDNKPDCKFYFSDIILLPLDTDDKTIRESADILQYHTNDIKSLYMLSIPDDNMKGITNGELNNFLEKSTNLESLNIEGNVRGKCRLIKDLSHRISCLKTLGLWNVAIPGAILNKLLTNENASGNMRSLGLFHIASPENLVTNFDYQFTSIHLPFNGWCGFLKKKRVVFQDREKPMQRRLSEAQPVLKDILKTLPNYACLSTLCVSYMESKSDRKVLLEVLRMLNKLQNIGYIGSSKWSLPDKDYDTAVIDTLLKFDNLRKIDFSEISMIDKGIIFQRTAQVERIWLQTFEMKSTYWTDFVESISSNKFLQKVFLYDTNIDEKSFNDLQRKEESRTSSLTIEKFECDDQ